MKKIYIEVKASEELPERAKLENEILDFSDAVLTRHHGLSLYFFREKEWKNSKGKVIYPSEWFKPIDKQEYDRKVLEKKIIRLKECGRIQITGGFTIQELIDY